MEGCPGGGMLIEGKQCWDCGSIAFTPDVFYLVQSIRNGPFVASCVTEGSRRNLRAGGRKTLFGTYKTPANGCCAALPVE